ncbi:MAG: endolytic transglycosylase MltG [Bryobacteraceae bacterium]
MKRLPWVVLVVLLLIGGATWRLRQPYRGFEEAVFVDLPRGTTTFGMGRRLAAAGVVRSPWDFVAARLWAHARVLQAGEYRFDSAATAAEIVRRLARGDVFYYALTVPEGWNMFDIAQAAGQFGVFTAGAFLRAARDPSLIRDLDPEAPSLEGYLFPETYRLTRHTTPRELCRQMTARFREAWNKAGAGNVHQTVTMASLVEREGKLPAERPLIAAVFFNRLRMGMTLDCDSTTIYAAMLDDRWLGAIHRSDLASDNPYNTYRHAGLPPGPIANPGLESIRAVLHPAASQALYFVARPDGSGGHQFSIRLADHQAAVKRYRRGTRN